MLSDPATSDKEIVIVDGGSLDVRAYYKRDSKLWGIEKKLLEIETAHEGIFYCEAMQMHDDEEDDFSSMFCCMHAVVDLFGSMLEDLDEEDLNQPSAVAANAKRKHLISMARTRTSRVVQNVMVAPTDRGGQLKVGWESLETNYARKRSTFSYAVTLHKEGRCKDKSQYLIQTPGKMLSPRTDVYTKFFRADSRKLCGCEAVQVPLHQDQHVFTDLDAGNGYFVTICHDDAVAIYATLFNKCEIEAAPVMEEEESPGLMPRESDALPSTEMEPPLSNAGYARASINCSSTTGDRLAHEAPVRDAQDGPVECKASRTSTSRQILTQCTDIPMDMEKLNLAEIMRRRWYEGQPDGPEEGVWMGIPKEEDGGEGTMEESTDERPTKRRRLLRDTR